MNNSLGVVVVRSIKDDDDVDDTTGEETDDDTGYWSFAFVSSARGAGGFASLLWLLLLDTEGSGADLMSSGDSVDIPREAIGDGSRVARMGCMRSVRSCAMRVLLFMGLQPDVELKKIHHPRAPKKYSVPRKHRNNNQNGSQGHNQPERFQSTTPLALLLLLLFLLFTLSTAGFR